MHPKNSGKLFGIAGVLEKEFIGSDGTNWRSDGKLTGAILLKTHTQSICR
jgi:hypothetical protein